MMRKKGLIVIIMVVLVAVVCMGCGLFGGSDKEEAANSLEEMYFYSPGDYFVTNIKDSTALSKVSVSLALSGDDQTEFLTESNAAIRDAIVGVMRSHTEDELRAVDVTTALSAEMVTAINEALEITDVHNVYISDFVIQ